MLTFIVTLLLAWSLGALTRGKAATLIIIIFSSAVVYVAMHFLGVQP